MEILSWQHLKCSINEITLEYWSKYTSNMETFETRCLEKHTSTKVATSPPKK